MVLCRVEVYAPLRSVQSQHPLDVVNPVHVAYSIKDGFVLERNNYEDMGKNKV